MYIVVFKYFHFLCTLLTKVQILQLWKLYDSYQFLIVLKIASFSIMNWPIILAYLCSFHFILYLLVCGTLMPSMEVI